MHTHSSGQTGPVTLTRHALRAAYAPPPARGLRSPQGAGVQGLLDLLAAAGVLPQDLAQVLLFLPLEDAQEVVELGHAEGIPLQGGGRQGLQRAWPDQQALSQRRPEPPGPTWGCLMSGSGLHGLCQGSHQVCLEDGPPTKWAVTSQAGNQSGCAQSP